MRLRKTHGDVSQKELARRAEGVSDSLIAQIETGDRGASLASLEAIAVALELTDQERLDLRAAAGVPAVKPGDSNAQLEEKVNQLERRLQQLEDAIDRAAGPEAP